MEYVWFSSTIIMRDNLSQSSYLTLLKNLKQWLLMRLYSTLSAMASNATTRAATHTCGRLMPSNKGRYQR